MGDSKAPTSINLIANSDYQLDVRAKATPGGATDAKAKELKFDPGTKIDTTAETIDLVPAEPNVLGDLVALAVGVALYALLVYQLHQIITGVGLLG